MIRRSGTGEMTDKEWERYDDPGWDYRIDDCFYRTATVLFNLSKLVESSPSMTTDGGIYLASTICAEIKRICSGLPEAVQTRYQSGWPLRAIARYGLWIRSQSDDRTSRTNEGAGILPEIAGRNGHFPYCGHHRCRTDPTFQMAGEGVPEKWCETQHAEGEEFGSNFPTQTEKGHVHLSRPFSTRPGTSVPLLLFIIARKRA